MKNGHKQFAEIPFVCPPEYEDMMRQEFESMWNAFLCVFEGERCNREELSRVLGRLWRCHAEQKDIDKVI